MVHSTCRCTKMENMSCLHQQPHKQHGMEDRYASRGSTWQHGAWHAGAWHEERAPEKARTHVARGQAWAQASVRDVTRRLRSRLSNRGKHVLLPHAMSHVACTSVVSIVQLRCDDGCWVGRCCIGCAHLRSSKRGTSMCASQMRITWCRRGHVHSSSRRVWCA